MGFIRFFSILMISVSICSSSAHAEEDVMEYELTPYIWGAGLSGDMGIRGRKFKVDKSFQELFESFDGGGAFAFEARGNKFGFLGSITYARTKDSESFRGVNVDVISESTIGEAALTYRVQGPGLFQIYAGLRTFKVKAEIDSNVDLLDLEESKSWVDPIVGLRMRFALNQALSLVLIGDIGGLGVSSDLVWNLIYGMRYDFNDRFFVTGGGRSMGVDYTDGGFTYDVTLSGFIVALGMKF